MPGRSTCAFLFCSVVVVCWTAGLAQDPLLSTPDTTTLPKSSCSVCGACDATFPSPSVQNEWMEMVPKAVVPVGGTVTTADISQSDLPFAHPFGNDFEGRMMPDANAPANIVDSTASRGRLVMEMEQGLIPVPFRPLIGDRIVMHGRWIVDCGHDYHTEIHPPFLIARGTISLYTGGSFQTFLGFPYLTGQTYSPLGKALIDTLVAQLTLGDWLPLQAYPYISNNPFPGSFTANYHVKLQTRTGQTPKFYYHFTTRTGVTVTLTPPTQADSSHASVKIEVDAGKYATSPAPECSTTNVSLNDADKYAGLPDGVIEAAAVAVAGSGLILGHPERLFLGVLYKQCKVSPWMMLNSLPPADNKIVTDDSQPFPVYGWIATDPTPLHNACPKSTLDECKANYRECMSGAGKKGNPTPAQCAAALMRCPKECVLPASQLARLSLDISVMPQGDQGYFTVQLDKVNTSLSLVQHHLSSLPIIVTPGAHLVSVVPGFGTSLGSYHLLYKGDCDANGNVNVALGQARHCSISLTAKTIPKPSACDKACKADYQDCLSSRGGPGSPTPVECSAGYKTCEATCR